MNHWPTECTNCQSFKKIINMFLKYVLIIFVINYVYKNYDVITLK